MSAVGESQASIERVHEALGEFVVLFQWVEHTYRQIGWFILDPDQSSWPPQELRTESNHDLVERVTRLFCHLTDQHTFPNGAEKRQAMEALQPRFHALRKYRNRLLHSSFVELKAGGDAVGYLRANARLGVDPDTGDIIHDQEIMTPEAIRDTLRNYVVLALSMILTQLRHWRPFGRFS